MRNERGEGEGRWGDLLWRRGPRQYHKRFEARCPLSSFVTHPCERYQRVRQAQRKKDGECAHFPPDLWSWILPSGFMEIIWMSLVESRHKWITCARGLRLGRSGIHWLFNSYSDEKDKRILKIVKSKLQLTFSVLLYFSIVFYCIFHMHFLSSYILFLLLFPFASTGFVCT